MLQRDPNLRPKVAALLDQPVLKERLQQLSQFADDMCVPASYIQYLIDNDVIEVEENEFSQFKHSLHTSKAQREPGPTNSSVSSLPSMFGSAVAKESTPKLRHSPAPPKRETERAPTVGTVETVKLPAIGSKPPHSNSSSRAPYRRQPVGEGKRRSSLGSASAKSHPVHHPKANKFNHQY